MTGVARLSPPSDFSRSAAAAVVVERPDLHDLGPVLPVPVAHQQQDGEPERPAVADPAQDLGTVLLDRLARPAAVAPLPAGEVDREGVLGQGEPRRHALDRDPQRRAVRLPGGEEAEGGHSPARRPPPRRAAAFAGRLALGRAQSAGPRLGQLRLHQVERRRLAGPQRERRRALVEQHQLAVRDRGARGLGVPQQPGPRVDEVEHEQVVVEGLGRDRAGVAGQADRCRVDEDLGLGQLRFDDRLVPRHRPQLHVRGRPPEVLDEAFGAVEVAVEHDDALEALADEAVHHGPAPTARPQDHRHARHLLPPDEPVERDLEARHVGVVADEPLALARERVHGARVRRLLGEAIDHGHDPFLVRDRDVGAEEVVAADLDDRVAQGDRGAIPRLVASVDAELIERRLLHRAGQRVSHRMTDEDDALGHARTPSRSLKKPG